MGMTEEYKYFIFGTELGYVGILGSAAGLRSTTLPQISERDVADQLSIREFSALSSEYFFGDLIERICGYYRGTQIDFPDKLDFSGATPFQSAVWRATQSIPYGETRSYGWVAGKIRRPGSYRAVGQALHRNPLSVIVPCHRVVGSGGQLVGFGGGLDLKHCLLELERQAVSG
jgi:methylated-DNA-[protein]-cysteine S-methyltransferase